MKLIYENVADDVLKEWERRGYDEKHIKGAIEENIVRIQTILDNEDLSASDEQYYLEYLDCLEGLYDLHGV